MSVTVHKPQQVSATGVMIPQNMEQAIRLAEMLGKSKNAVPSHLQNDPGSILLVIDQAMRWQMSPLAVAQATFVYKGKLGFEGKLIAAAIESTGAIDGLMDYRFDGDGEQRRITAFARRHGERAPKEVTVWLKDAKTENEQWKKQPDQQLVYHSARVWARRWTPGVILGVYTREEFDDPTVYEGATVDGEVVDTGDPTGTREAINAAIKLAETKLANLDAVGYHFTTRQGVSVFATSAEWLDAWRKLIRNCIAARALDKLDAAEKMNLAHIENAALFDAPAAAALREALDAAHLPGEGDGDVA